MKDNKGDRKCYSCSHKKDGGCEVWECDYSPTTMPPMHKYQFELVASMLYDSGKLRAYKDVIEGIDDGCISCSDDVRAIRDGLMSEMNRDYCEMVEQALTK